MKFSRFLKVFLAPIVMSGLLSQGALAGQFDFVKADSPEAQAVKEALDKGDYHTALVKWPANMSASSTNQALFAYALFKDKMVTLGFDRLNVITDLSSISPKVKALWLRELNLNSPFWRNEKVVWTKKLSSFFPAKTADVISAWNVRDLSSSKIRTTLALLAKVQGTDAATWLKWQLALAYGVQGKSKEAVNFLQDLLNSDQKVVGQDEVYMAAARLLYQDNKLDAAMKYYDRIPKSSDYWLESVEEKGWIFARLNNFDRALGEMKTALIPALSAQVGPESYFLATLSDLRVCDYYDIFKVLHAFRSANRDRMVDIQKLASTGHTPEGDRAISKMEKGISSWAEIGSDSIKLPRFLNRDEVLDRAVAQLRDADLQLDEVNALAAANPFYAVYKTYAQGVKTQSSPLAYSRLKVLAQSDVSEMKKNLIKLQLVETEAIHRMTVGQNHTQSVKTQAPELRDEEQFPFEENEIWLDEVGHYQTITKGCPAATQKQEGSQKL